MGGLGRSLILVGIVLVIAGVVISLGDRLPFRIGRLPGDLVYRGKNTTVYLPIVTSILFSIVLTLIFWIAGRFR